ncbi:SpoIIAA family protein [Psychromonas ingrahamii]|uniref:STAS/SEC14 domain-containing protein n=1 Tax=Psychromonas ingrahamii TaxID=357794 RepID=UPI00031DC57E|nr:STAS/SEC14 domain-containing protein [Psychromonas ingrahamii]
MVFNKLIEEYDKINILVVLDGKINFGVDVAYQDLKWIFKHLKNINKRAIVSEFLKVTCWDGWWRQTVPLEN